MGRDTGTARTPRTRTNSTSPLAGIGPQTPWTPGRGRDGVLRERRPGSEAESSPPRQPPAPRGRGAAINPTNRFEKLSLELVPDHIDEIIAEQPDGQRVRTLVYLDRSRTVINRVLDSPDLGFDWTINPYRGCEHGCSYCYARPTHEHLGFSAGLDFETKIVAKVDAPRLVRAELRKKNWPFAPIVMSGVTDPYQPVERKLRITRGILEAFVDVGQPVSIITKSALIERDLDLLTELGTMDAASVAVSLTTLDNKLSSVMEPRAASPSARLATIRALTDAGVPVSVMVAPVIPGINDQEIPALLEAAGEAGATNAGWVLLRLPHGVKDVFLQWLQRELPDRAKKVEAFIRETRLGELYEAAHGIRNRGRGERARQIAMLFELSARRAGLSTGHESLASGRRRLDGGQLGLFA